ncbi:MAG: hypothetical protein ACD_31C00005G0012 [uncultured bacterium]|uniref:Glycosyl transferase family 1 domain-containing protein n=3 Tax=Candidatus Daviesiibacteriota TaxID=1752718 RepID=A0A0G0EYP1_9BACT|nr:MAG: hypothetical protein ACD_31C00005G0012 [uncultured bacterium]KKQ10587.1 MAG: hypothetical protein US19_C0002G0006 [Candidatus Daviesbacteria bacterium GW2011_GWB1_36_5]KKQ15716.1 MAG: hypothetical protein US28_C0011G0012 [Candidatus Daviesbacteria bacterium GW2011_GWA1_36_8]OGE17865.1 MAG: hypothetical protein A2858_03920 [Candidatus Daviesbacteria bacterium RIFCSPHIGHO2_01_FULL_36_37]
MKILYLVSGLGPPAGWGTEYIQDLIFHLSDKGIHATIINPILSHTHPEWKKWSINMEKKHNIKFININPPNWIKNNFYLYLILLPFITTPITFYKLYKQRYDLVHEFSSTPIILIRSLFIRIFFKVPIIFTHSVYNNTILGTFFWFKIFDFANIYIIQSKEILNKLKKIGIRNTKLNLIYPCLNISKFNKKRNMIASRKLLKLPANKFIYSYFGSLTTEKGVNDIIKACKLIPSKFQKNILLYLFVVWKGSNEHKKLKNSIYKANLPFLKLIESYVDIPTLLNASDAVIFPQRTGMGTTIPPLSIIEALIAKKKIIATNIIGVKEWTKTGSLTIIPPNNPQALLNSILKIQFKKTKKLKYLIPKLDIETISSKYYKQYFSLNSGFSNKQPTQ